MRDDLSLRKEGADLCPGAEKPKSAILTIPTLCQFVKKNNASEIE
jgi:hypothetical protein